MGFTQSDWSVIFLSVKVAAVSTALLLPAGIVCGHILARRRGRLIWILETLANIPLVLPPVVVGFLLLGLFSRQGALGGWLYATFGVSVVLDFAGAVLAAIVVSFPLVAQASRIAIGAVDKRLEEAAHTLGAGPIRTWLTVTLPIAWPGIAAGALLGFTRSLGEFGATLVVAGNIAGRTRTLPMGIFTHLNAGRDQAAWRLAIVAVALSAAAMIFAQRLLRKRPQ